MNRSERKAIAGKRNVPQNKGGTTKAFRPLPG